MKPTGSPFWNVFVKHLRIEVVGLYDIFHWEHGGNSPEANAVTAVWFIALPRIRRTLATIRTVP